MRVVGESTVFRNAYPTYRAEAATSTTVTWGAVGSEDPYLLCCFRVGQTMMSPDGRIRAAASRDLGTTWTGLPSPLSPSPPASSTTEAAPHAGSSPHGTSILASARMELAVPGTDQWDDATAGTVDATTVVVRGRQGSGWEAPSTLDLRRGDDEWAIPCGPAVWLGEGHWILPMERHTKSRVPDWLRRYHAFGAISRDDGVSWAAGSPTLNDPAARLAYYDQRIARLGDGTLLTMAWCHDVVIDRSLAARWSVSHDEGASWSPPGDTRILTDGSIMPCLLDDGRLIAVYSRRTGPPGVLAATSEDGGRSWAVDGELVIWDERVRRVTGETSSFSTDREYSDPLWESMWLWESGAPTCVSMPGGGAGVVFFCTGQDGVARVKFVRIEV